MSKWVLAFTAAAVLALALRRRQALAPTTDTGASKFRQTGGTSFRGPNQP